MRFPIIAAAAMVMMALPPVASGQAVDSARDCFRGRPLPECRSFWITELGYYRTALGSDRPAGTTNDQGSPMLRSHAEWELGLMRNRSANRADGYIAQIGFSNGGVRVGGSRRYRFWLSRPQSVDLSVGVVHESPGNGLTADVSYGLADLAAVSLRGDVVRANGHTFGAIYTGVKLGSFPALLTTAAGILYAGLIILAYSGEGT